MELQGALRELEQKAKSRHSASKYDFVKVKVWLGDNQDHYYVLSRFLISRMLTVTKVPMNKAVKISLEVKKYLVDNNHLDISQDHLEAILFGVMRSRGYDDKYVQRYKMVTSFFQQRRPLIILICGVPCTGKSTLAQQLASRLNMPNVLQTDIIYELLRGEEDSPLAATPLWERPDLPPAALVGEFQRECRVVRKGLDGDLHKCIRDGKSIIMEGLHLDPGLYLYGFGRYGQAHLLERPPLPGCPSCQAGPNSDPRPEPTTLACSADGADPDQAAEPAPDSGVAEAADARGAALAGAGAGRLGARARAEGPGVPPAPTSFGTSSGPLQLGMQAAPAQAAAGAAQAAARFRSGLGTGLGGVHVPLHGEAASLMQGAGEARLGWSGSDSARPMEEAEARWGNGAHAMGDADALRCAPCQVTYLGHLAAEVLAAELLAAELLAAE